MRKSFAVGFVLVLFVAAGCGGGSTPKVLPKLPAPPPTSKLFNDPNGAYTMTISPLWVDTGTIIKQVQSWAIAGDRQGFTDNVSVITAQASGMDLLQYMSYTKKHLKDMQYLGTWTTTGAHGNQLGVLEYHGKAGGTHPDLEVHFLQTIDIRDGTVVVVTLATTESSFVSERARFETYLRTIQNIVK